MTIPREDAMQAAGRAAKAAKEAKPNGPAIDARSLYWTVEDIVELKPPAWLVAGLIPRGAKVLSFGGSGGYKSVHAVDLGCHLAHGMNYHGLATIRCPLCYIANEDAYGLAVHHIQGWHRYHGKPSGRVIVIPGNVKLDQPDDVQTILAAARHAFGKERPLFVVDTWDRSLNGDQDRTADVNPGLNALDALLAAGVATLTNSHSPWGDKSRTKGSVTFWANHDTRLKAEKNETTKRGTLKVIHHKHAKDGLVLTFDFDLYEFQGHPAAAKITTLIPRRIYDAPTIQPPKPSSNARTRLTDEQSLALQALQDEADQARRWDFSFPTAQEIWVRCDAIDQDLTEPQQGKRAHRLRQQLAKRGLIKLDAQLIRLVGP
jgi:hypothetical protein